MRHSNRSGTQATALALALAVSLQLAAQERGQVLRTDLPAQPMSQAIQEIARQADINILADRKLVEGRQGPPIQAGLSVQEALTRLLEGTGLTSRYVDERTVMLTVAGEPESRQPAENGENAGASADRERANSLGEQINRSSRYPEGRQESEGYPPAASPGVTEMDAIVVTAQKRVERLQEVPVPVTVVDTDTLVNTNQIRLQDYYTSIPGLSLTPHIGSSQVLAIRGITTGLGIATVGVTIDDVPYGASSQSGANIVPDIDPGDLVRVEVLRGPQGTLYGASSLGGLLKFVTVDPSTEGFGGHLQGGISSVSNGSGMGHNIRAGVNVPLGNTVAIRASGFTRKDPGYVDNVQSGEDGVNSADAEGGRMSLLWQPSEVFSLRLNALLQQIKGHGSSSVYLQPGMGELEHDALPRTGGYDRRTQAYSAILAARLGSADFTALTGYNINRFTDSVDFTYALGSCSPPVTACTEAQFGVAGTPLVNHIKTHKFTQELRLEMPVAPNVDWLFGLFYTHEDTRNVQSPKAANSSGELIGTWGDLDLPVELEEYAAFTNITFRLTDRFDIQLGGRQSRIEQISSQTVSGLYATVVLGQPSSPFVLPEVKSRDNPFTYLLTPRFRLSPNLMVYGRFASGYRAGGPNVPPGVPRQFESDRTRNYEVGLKGDFLDRLLTVDASLYYIDWDNIQINLFDTSTFQYYTGNAGSARSRGIELSVRARPLAGTTIASWVSLNDAELTEDFPGIGTGGLVFGLAGDRLPNSSRFTGNVSFEQEFSLTDTLQGVVGALMSYVGDRQSDFASTFASPPVRTEFPAYTRTDVHVGVRSGFWSASLFVNNLTDKRGVLNGGIGHIPPFAFLYIQPRTVGLTVSRSF